MSYLLANLVLLPIAIALVYSMHSNIRAETNYGYLLFFGLLVWYILASVFQMIVDFTRFVRAEWGRYREVRFAREQGRERAERAQTRLTARRVYSGTDVLPGNAVAHLFSFLGVPPRVTIRGPPSRE
jgi:hypothetical protein